jgi:hypothetical protein
MKEELSDSVNRDELRVDKEEGFLGYEKPRSIPFHVYTT